MKNVRSSNIAILLAHAFVVWVLCGAVIGIGTSITSEHNTLIVHAFAAPIFAAAVSAVYYRRFNFTSPRDTAVIVLVFIMFMDTFVAAILIQGNLEMFKSILGTWLPFALIFAATYLTGLASTRQTALRVKNA